MSSNQHTALEVLAGTLSGTVLTVIWNIGSADVLKTGVLAAIGAVVSFSVTFFLKWLSERKK